MYISCHLFCCSPMTSIALGRCGGDRLCPITPRLHDSDTIFSTEYRRNDCTSMHLSGPSTVNLCPSDLTTPHTFLQNSGDTVENSNRIISSFSSYLRYSVDELVGNYNPKNRQTSHTDAISGLCQFFFPLKVETNNLWPLRVSGYRSTGAYGIGRSESKFDLPEPPGGQFSR
jgi:hypothetical protein